MGPITPLTGRGPPRIGPYFCREEEVVEDHDEGRGNKMNSFSKNWKMCSSFPRW